MALVPIEPKEAVRLGAESLLSFGRIFLPRTFRQNSPAFHEEIGRALYSPARYNAFQVFRGGAKTTLLRTFTAQRICYGISRTIMYVSVSQGHAVHSIRWLKRNLLQNRLIAEIFRLRKGSKWTDELIEIEHGIEGVPITVMAMGITGQIRGFNIDDYRPDLIVADDILNEENTATREYREKLEALFFGALVNSLAPQSEAPYAKAVLLQTPLHSDDISQKCMADPQWHGVRFSVFDEEGKSRWPERFPLDVLKREKESYTLRGHYRLWMREMECQLVAGEDKIFDTSRLLFWDVLPENLSVVIAIDPASSDSKEADYNVVMAVGFSGPNVYVLDYFAEKGVMPDAVAARFFELVWRWRPRKAAVEIVSYQRVLKWYLEREMVNRRVFIPIDAIQDKRKKSDRIIQELAGITHMGFLHIRPSMTDLIAQMDGYNPGEKKAHDDILDALAMAVASESTAYRTIEGEYSYEVEELEYQPISLGACP